MPLVPVSVAQPVVEQKEGEMLEAVHPSRQDQPKLTGAGVVDLAFQSASTDDPQGTLRALELFAKEVLPRIRDL